MAKQDTKQKLIEAGTDLFLRRGYNDTGIQQVLMQAGVPKGSFYHHFKSKEEFGLAVVKAYGEQTMAALEEIMAEQSVAPLARVQRFFEEAFDDFKDNGCRLGCLLGTLGQELAQVNDTFREAIEAYLNAWAECIVECLEEAKREGAIAPDQDNNQLAQAMIDGFQGAALRMKLERHPAALQRFISHFFKES